MGRPEKFINSLNKDDRLKLEAVLSAIQNGNFEKLDIRKLKGYDDFFCIRVGKFRIICKRDRVYGLLVIKIGFRNDTTYNL